MQELMANAQPLYVDVRGRQVYLAETSTGSVEFVCLGSHVQYRTIDAGHYTGPNLWSLTASDSFLQLITLPFALEILAQRVYGMPKLKKPKALKGVKPAFTVRFTKATCPVFIHDDAIWIKHRDFFSHNLSPNLVPPGEVDAWYIQRIGRAPAKRFVYADGTPTVVLRNESWLKLAGAIPLLQAKSANTIALVFLQHLSRQVNNSNLHHDNTWLHFAQQLCQDAQKALVSQDQTKSNKGG